MTEELGKCDCCGKYVYDLLDRMWTIRRYSYLLNPTVYDPANVEYIIDVLVHENMRRLQLGPLIRSKLFTLYSKACHIVTHQIIPALVMRGLRKPQMNLRDCWWWEKDFPIPMAEDLIFLEDSIVYPKFRYVLQVIVEDEPE